MPDTQNSPLNPQYDQSPSPDASQGSRPPKNGSGYLSKREKDDSYCGTLFPIPETSWRVAVCPKGYCWMLQQRRGRDQWISRKFFARKKRLAQVVRDMFPEAWATVGLKILALPL